MSETSTTNNKPLQKLDESVETAPLKPAVHGAVSSQVFNPKKKSQYLSDLLTLSKDK